MPYLLGRPTVVSVRGGCEIELREVACLRKPPCVIAGTAILIPKLFSAISSQNAAYTYQTRPAAIGNLRGTGQSGRMTADQLCAAGGNSHFCQKDKKVCRTLCRKPNFLPSLAAFYNCSICLPFYNKAGNLMCHLTSYLLVF